MPVVVVHQSERVVGVFGREAERVRFGNVERREGRVGGRGGHRAERCVLVVRRDSSCLLERDDVGDVLVPVVRIEEVPSALALQDERTRRNRLRRIPCNNETEGLHKSLTANGKEGQTLIPIPNGKTGLTFFPIRDGARMARNCRSASCRFPVSLCSHRHVVNALFTDGRDSLYPRLPRTETLCPSIYISALQSDQFQIIFNFFIIADSFHVLMFTVGYCAARRAT